MPTVLDELNSALHAAFSADQRIYLLGEDVLDPYGGAFKVTRGLSSAYPGRVISTPISEAGLVGIATGMALRGLRPIVEIMFGDFVTLIADQVINHAAKFRWMYNDQVRVPLVIRTPMGGRRGYGPTHSQTLEKIFLGTPGLNMLAPSSLSNPGDLLKSTILETEDPVLFIENKLLYLLPAQAPGQLKEFSYEFHSFDQTDSSAGQPGFITKPAIRLRVRGAPPPTLTLATYGYMLELAMMAARQLAYEDEIFIEIVAPNRLAPVDMYAIIDSASETRRLLAIEEGTLSFGWGAEVITRVSEKLGGSMITVRRLAALDLPIPAAGLLETSVLPGMEQIVQMVKSMVR